jgi:hypothetical protein
MGGWRACYKQVTPDGGYNRKPTKPAISLETHSETRVSRLIEMTSREDLHWLFSGAGRKEWF